MSARRVVLVRVAHVALLLTGALAAAAHASAPLVFTDVNVVAMTDERVLNEQDVVIEDGRILRLGDAAPASRPANAVVIDGRNRYLMPGIAEMHAHVPGPDRREFAEDVLLLFVAHGVTTIRGMLGHPWHLELRERIADGEVIGPRLYTAGPSFNGNTVPDVATAVRMVREQHAAGYDFLKLHPGLTVATFDAIAATAREVGIPFEGHVSEAVGLVHALERGQRAIDHLDGYVHALAKDQCARTRAAGFFGIGLTPCIDAERIPQLVAATRRAGTAIVPTQVLLEQWARPPTEAELRSREAVKYLPERLIERWLEARAGFLGLEGLRTEDARAFIDVRRRLIRELDQAGVAILLGSDAPQVFNVPGASAIAELELYVAAGLTPHRALLTATAKPAEHFGAGDRFGSVAVGREADLLLLAANPLEDVRALHRLEGVMLRGQWLPRAELDRRLSELARRQAR